MCLGNIPIRKFRPQVTGFLEWFKQIKKTIKIKYNKFIMNIYLLVSIFYLLKLLLAGIIGPGEECRFKNL